MGLRLHRAERTDRLADELGVLLTHPLPDPFMAEIVSVPTRGVERWLAQTLSHHLGVSPDGRDGVCAGVEFPSPGRLTRTAVAAVSDVDPATDPWQPGRAVWPLVHVIDEARGEDWAALISSYLSDRTGDGSRRWSTAQHCTDLFDRYAADRPEMVHRWLEGHDVDAAGDPLSPEHAWQPELLRRLRAAIGLPSPAERLADACDRLRDEPAAVDLPPRLSVFGISRLDPVHRRVLSALAVQRDVHLWLPHPSDVLWGRIRDALAASATLPSGRSEGSVTGPATHRLLSYLGRDVRELQITLADAEVERDQFYPDDSPADGPTCLLHALQRDISADRDLSRRPAHERHQLAGTDGSVQVHASHGPDRQVEVLRELLTGLLADDPTLQPRDILVMCPDIETFAPLISASFGLDTATSTAEHPGHRLRVRLADRSIRQISEPLSVLSRVLDLVDSRMEASQLLDLLGSPAVAAKFRLSTDDVDRLHDLVLRAGVKWGLSAQHRVAFGMGQFPQNTWRAGLDRLLLGVTMDESGQHYLQTALPMDDVDSTDIDRVGRLAEFVDRLDTFAEACQASPTLPQWMALCADIVDALAAVPPADAWQISHAHRALSELGATENADAPVPLQLAEVRSLLSETLRGRPSRANFRTGTLTMCTMMPMRSLPHRVVCLMGVDDGVFPRHPNIDGDDVAAADPRIGDRDPRSEDRQLLLDAVMAAREHLVIIYAGADARTGAAVPPAVPVGELLDVLDLTAQAADGGSVRDHVMARHPLQPFDRTNFETDTPSAVGAAGVARATTEEPFSFDVGALRGARAAVAERRPHEVTFPTLKLDPPTPSGAVDLDDLVRFFNHPLKALLRVRAGLYLGDDRPAPEDEMPVRLDPLASWAVGDRLLKLHLEGADRQQLADAEWRRGTLPPRHFGDRALSPILDVVEDLGRAAAPLRLAGRTSVDLTVPLGQDLLTGTVGSIYGTRLVQVGYSRVAAKHRLAAWVRLLALAAAEPQHRWTATVVGKGGRIDLPSVSPGFAAKVLADLVDLYQTGLREPIPYAPKVSEAYARDSRDAQSANQPHARLEQLWDADRDQVYERFYGVGAPLSALMAEPARSDEQRGAVVEPTRFGSLARRVWTPMLTAYGSQP